VSEPQRYELEVSASAARIIQLKLSEAVAAAVIEFITGSLLEDPRRAGKELRNELAGTYSARRGAFRVLYDIDDRLGLVTVLRIDHRADVYRPR